MNSGNRQAYVSLALVFVMFAAMWSLGVVLHREWVKKDLRDRGFRPLSVRWRLWGWWGGFYGSCFLVRYVDSAGLIHRGRCWVEGIGQAVVWRSDEIIGDVSRGLERE